MPNDIVIDALDTLIDILRRGGASVMPEQRTEAERILRAAWGGDRVYIAKLGEDGQRQISARDAAIRREAARGAHVGLLARRHALSPRRVREILQMERTAMDSAAACLIGRHGGGDSAVAAAQAREVRAKPPKPDATRKDKPP